MGLFSDIIDVLGDIGDQALTIAAYSGEAKGKYDFRDFDAAVDCCDEANSTEEAAMVYGYAIALIESLSDLNTNGRVSDEYIVEIYGYCRGMHYDYFKKELENMMDELIIDY